MLRAPRTASDARLHESSRARAHESPSTTAPTGRRERRFSPWTGPHKFFGADVADASSAQSLVEGVVREMGGIDVLINNAAIFEAHPVLEVYQP